jgi:hypothetical protein
MSRLQGIDFVHRKSFIELNVQKLCWMKAATASCWVPSNASRLRGWPCKGSRRSLTMDAW